MKLEPSGETVADEQGREAETFARLYPGLRRFAGAVCSSDIDPDDLVQDALALVLRLGGLDRLTNPNRYLTRTIINLEANHRRRQLRARRAHERVDRVGDLSPSYPSDLSILDELPPLDRAVLFLVDVEGASFGQAAAELGRTEVALRLRASRARRRLRGSLEAGEQP